MISGGEKFMSTWNPEILFYYHPTTLVLVDDLQKFLKSFELFLSTKYLCKGYHEPKTALLDIQNSKNTDLSDKKWIVLYKQENGEDRKLFDISWEKIRAQIYNPKRFAEFSTALVDYAMPSINGLDFCERLKELSIKKIMVTGEASHELAVKAFNNGLIDKFIRKNDPDFESLVIAAVEEMQHKYFCDLTKPLIKNLICNKEFALQYAEVHKIFTDICQKHKIIEYYMIDNFGSYLLLDANANISWFVIKSDAEVEKYVCLTRDYMAKESLIRALQKRQIIPFFFNREDEEKPFEELDQYWHKSQAIETSNGNFHYAFVTGANANAIHHKEIVGYKDFLNAKDWHKK